MADTATDLRESYHVLSTAVPTVLPYAFDYLTKVEKLRFLFGGLQQLAQSQPRMEKRNSDSSDSDLQQGTCVHDLPIQVKLKIFSYLDAETLCRVSSVCKEWYELGEDSLLWKARLRIDSKKWKEISHNTNPLLCQEVNSDWTFKENYLHCCPEVQQRLQPSPSNTFFGIVMKYFKSFSNKKPRLIMFGPGLESYTSPLVRKIIWDELHLGFRTTGMIPGTDGVGSGICLDLNGRQFSLITLYSTCQKVREEQAQHGDRMRHHQMLRPAGAGSFQVELIDSIKDISRTADAFVFVIDAKEENVELGKVELRAMLQEKWFDLHVPLVVLSCVDEVGKARIPCLDVVRSLELQTYSRPWKVNDSCVETMDGVVPSFNWLLSQIRS